MNIIFRQFASEQVVFSSELDAGILIEKLNAFCNKGFFDFSVNLDGDVKGNGVFEFTKKWSFTNGGGMYAVLTAVVLPDSKGSIVNVKVKPDYRLAVMAIIFFTCGLILAIHSMIGKVFNPANLFGGFVFMTCSIFVMAFMSYLTKSGLAVKFSETFDLQKL